MMVNSDNESETINEPEPRPGFLDLFLFSGLHVAVIQKVVPFDEKEARKSCLPAANTTTNRCNLPPTYREQGKNVSLPKAVEISMQGIPPKNQLDKLTLGLKRLERK
jgi:hypothetical protein